MDPAAPLLALLLFPWAGSVQIDERIANGLTVRIAEDPSASTVTAELVIQGAGELYVPAALSGQASLTAQMLAKGTRGRSAKEIAGQLDRLGAVLKTAAPYGGETTTITLTAPGESFEQALFLTADVLVNPAFPPEEFDALREQELAAFEQRAKEPLHCLDAHFRQALFGAHPLRLEPPTSAALRAITRDHLVQWHRERYAPQNATLVIAGPVNAKDVLNKVKRLNFVWTRMAFTPKPPEIPAPPKERRIHLIHHPGAGHALLRVGTRIPAHEQEDLTPLLTWDRLLRSRLGLPEERLAGSWSVTLSVPADAAGPALSDLLNEIRRLTDEPDSASAAKYLNVDALQIVAVGDAAALRDALAALGPVVELEQGGK